MGDAIEKEQRYERPNEVLVREVGDEMVLLDTVSEQYHSLNDVGRRCYELLSEGCSTDETVETICAEYDAPVDQVHADLQELLAGLVGSGLLRSVQ